MEEYILLLGMVFSNEHNPSRGQEFRDRVRCEALENLGFHIRTLDNKHTLLNHGKHCQADFCDCNRMLKDIQLAWGENIQFRHIILDYFFSPVGWARERWKPSFFTKTIPIIAQSLLAPGGILWLPHLDNVSASIELNLDLIEQFFTVHEIVDPFKNPLYVASENCEDELLLCPDSIINANQVAKLSRDFPFYALQLKCHILPLVADNNDDLAAVDDEEGDDNAQETLLMWESISATPKLRDTLLFRVFSGAIDSTQAGPFKAAMQAYKRSMASSSSSRTIIVEEIDTKTLCSLKWQPHQFCNYLLHSHAYFMLGHVHQSLLLHQLLWYMPEALAEYNRLKYHTGFPSGEQLRCPVFTQDKIDYIKRLGDLAIPTLTVPLDEDGSYTDACLAEVKRFMQGNEENKCGWIIKAPFTTNCESVRFPKSFEEMKKFMRSLSKKYVGHLPYLMIQPCMYNRHEVKIVVLNNQPMYKAGISTGSSAKCKSGINKVFSSDDAGLLAFASEAIAKLRETAPYAITDGLFRVDIFQNIEGKMVVNEFESLDAGYGSLSKNALGVDYQSLTCSFLRAYWQKKIQACVESIN